jgi:hypothetical protein
MEAFLCLEFSHLHFYFCNISQSPNEFIIETEGFNDKFMVYILIAQTTSCYSAPAVVSE